MKKYFKWLTKKQPLRIYVNGVLLILVIILCIVSGKLKSSLPSQQFANRWSTGEFYEQVSVFFSASAGLNLDGMHATIDMFEKKLAEASALTAKSKEDFPLVYSYSSEGSLFVQWHAFTVEVAATGVAKDFFMFHPLHLVSGSYLNDSDLMQDRVVIDTNLAWQLFGATNVAGMEINIGGLPYIIAGVVLPEDDFASAAAYGDKPRIYMSYEALLGNDNSAKITCLELLTPKPVENFTTQTIKTVFEEQFLAENDRDIVNNTKRYLLPNLFGVMGDFGLRCMRSVSSPSYPYWENAGRMVENYLAVILIIIGLLLIFPAVSLIHLSVRLWRGRKWQMGDFKKLIVEKLEAHKEQKTLSDKL